MRHAYEAVNVVVRGDEVYSLRCVAFVWYALGQL